MFNVFQFNYSICLSKMTVPKLTNSKQHDVQTPQHEKSEGKHYSII